MWNLKWNTIPYEKTLPVSERHFVQLDPSKPMDFKHFFLIPLGFYYGWVMAYYLINFVFAAERIKNRNFENMYRYYSKKEWFNKFIPFVSQKPDQESSPVQDETTASNRFGSLFSFLFGLCHESPAFVLLIILSLYTYHLKQRLLLLEDLVDEIQMKMNQLEVISVGETPYMLS